VSQTRSILSWAGAVAIGFALGIVFSAWKLESVSPTNPHGTAVKQQDVQSELKSRIAGIEKMLLVKPDNAQALIQLGNDYFDLGEYQKAVESYQKALRIDPQNPDVLTDMAISYRKLGKSEQTVQAFKRALEIDPNHQLALFNLGIVLRDDLKDDKGALQAWEKFLELAPDSPHSVMVTPWVKQLREKLAKASENQQ
jgi:cytochrome c-type biogenesis protein CcmH/NrfG